MLGSGNPEGETLEKGGGPPLYPGFPPRGGALAALTEFRFNSHAWSCLRAFGRAVFWARGAVSLYLLMTGSFSSYKVSAQSYFFGGVFLA